MRPWWLACLEQESSDVEGLEESFGCGGQTALSRRDWLPDAIYGVWFTLFPIELYSIILVRRLVRMILIEQVWLWDVRWAGGKEITSALLENSKAWHSNLVRKKEYGQSETSACTMSAHTSRTTYMLEAGIQGASDHQVSVLSVADTHTHTYTYTHTHTHTYTHTHTHTHTHTTCMHPIHECSTRK